MHALFEAIERSADIDGMDDEALVAIGRSLAPRRDDAWHGERIASVRAALAEPAVRAAYDGAITTGETVVRVEFPFLRRTPHGVQTGFIDRLVLHLDGPSVAGDPPPKVVGASIIDFKTDRPDPGVAGGPDAELAGFLERHRGQMNAYRAVIAERYGLDPSRISVSLIRVDDARIVEVPPPEGG